MPDDFDRYRSPLETRYASEAMQRLWSDGHRFRTWRRLWLALAESQQELGLDIRDNQLQALRDHLDDIDYDSAAAHERRLRHDVMAHVHTLGEAAPEARGIIHLGATSQFVNCNAELLILREAMNLLAAKTAAVIIALGEFASEWKTLPTLGFTHYQPAQPITVGRRAITWAQDFWLSLEDLEFRLASLRFRGVRGATGTQASFLALFDGDEEKVEELDRLVTQRMGWPEDRRLPVTGQTYPRIVDAHICSCLAAMAAAVHKCATDIRLLANRKEIEEPFGTDQIGSSAMPYKRNPMRCERACGMSRFVMSLAGSPLQTASAQWFERTLDDSANRRLVLPQSFLALDGCLDIMRDVLSGLVVYPETIRRNLEAELPFMASEELLMEAVRAGRDRQEVHEAIRQHAQEAAHRVKSEGADNDLIERLREEPLMAGIDLEALLEPSRYVGRSVSQVDRFNHDIVGQVRSHYSNESLAAATLKV
ncbi:MAG: adenylosuccinate lyase [Planctomycetota bacterium]|nr:adenylosuccinate lyase [Planctomycetota bacterium]